MASVLAGLFAGLLFGTGLVLSGMTLPAKVIGFLDVAGNWDPSLALVMAGAIGVYAPAYRWITRSRSPFYASAFAVPGLNKLDTPLLAGAALFGAGWGLAGFCPGPGLVAAGSGQGAALLFVASMWSGMWLHRLVTARPRSAQQTLATGGGA